MNFLWLLLTPLVSFFTFWRDWARGFTIAEILNRRLDFIATNILVTSFLTGFRPLVFFIKEILFLPFVWIIGLFKPQIKKNYYEKKCMKLYQKLEKEREKFQEEINKFKKRGGITKLSPSLEEREEEKELDE